MFGRYKLLSLLGKGGTAKVYRALRPGPMGFGKEVALKIIEPDHSLGDEPMVSLANEARLGCLLRHPNIVVVVVDEFDTVDGAFYIAMEYIDGWPLERMLRTTRRRKGRVPLTVVLEVMLAICAGLDYAHRLADKGGTPLGLVHRDLKPGNVMISRRGEVKIADFGTAKARTNIKETQQGFTRGTPAYMSPEQVGGKKLDQRSDIFSLGLMLHELTTLQMAFEGEDIISVMQKVLLVDAREVSARLEKVAPALAPILLRCLARDRDHRYPTAGAVAEDLRRIQARVGTTPGVKDWVDRLEEQLPVSKTGEFGWDASLVRGGAPPKESEVPTRAPEALAPAPPPRPAIQPVSVSAPARPNIAESGRSAVPPRETGSVFAPAPATSRPSPDYDAPTVGETRSVGRPQVREPDYEKEMETLDEPMSVSRASSSAFLPPEKSAPPPPRSQPGRRSPSAPLGPPMAPRERPSQSVSVGANLARLRVLATGTIRIVLAYLALLLLLPSLPGKAGEFMVAARDWHIGVFTGTPAPLPWNAVRGEAEAPTISPLAADLVQLEAGTIRLGEPASRSAVIEVPAVAFQSHEVTVAEYEAGCLRKWWQRSCPDWHGPTEGQNARHPAVKVTWSQAKEWCEVQGLRLPTEAEWEYAARGSEERKFPWGPKWRKGAMNYCDFGCSLPVTMEDDGFEQTSPARQFPVGKTPEGLYDMAGNVAEWTLDCWTEDIRGKTSWHASNDPACSRRVARGGSYTESVEEQTGWRRLQANPDLGIGRIGFRCVQGEIPYAE